MADPQFISDETLSLSSREPLFEGRSRWCYLHPDDGDLIVKVPKPRADPARVRGRSGQAFRHLAPDSFYDVQERDLRTYRHLRRRLGEAVDRVVPRVHGYVRTDIGTGLVVDFARNADGTPGVPSHDYIGGEREAEMLESVDALRRFVLDRGVPVRDFSPLNIVLVRRDDETLEARLVDGFGSADLLPLWRWSRTFAALRARKAVGKFDRRLKERRDALQGR